MKPILFSGEMVRAILDGRKTQTRRVVKLQPGSSVSARGNGIWQELHKTSHPTLGAPGKMLACPYGMPGDLLWVRETWATPGNYDHIKPSLLTDHMMDAKSNIVYRATEEYPVYFNWRPSIFMPRWASRITLRVVDVRVETLWDMTVSKMIAEGVAEIENNDKHPLTPFIALWDSINADRGHAWYTDPWVWVVEFEVVS